MAKERIGIMGGTLDPIHEGHLHMAREALSRLKLDKVLMLPSGQPPHKTGVTPKEDRWRMVCAACAQEDRIEPCRMELDREGTIYTVDTLTQMHSEMKNAELYYLIGSDTLMELSHWHDWEQVLTKCIFAVYPRASRYTAKELTDQRRYLTGLGGQFVMLDAELIDVSSTDLREALRTGQKTPLLPATVREYCALKGLYGMQARIPQSSEWLPMLFADLNRKRFSHTLAVAHTARQLAVLHGLDADKAEIAGLLHDCAKCLPLKEMRQICLSHDLTRDESILESGALMHALAGACLAEEKYGVKDREILDAIAAHTTGKPGMSRLSMVVYLADKIEPTRSSYPLLEQVRLLSTMSPERALMLSMEGTAEHVKKVGKSVHPASAATQKWLKALIADKQPKESTQAE